LAVQARVVVDATGDADIAAYAGAPVAVGSEEFAGLNMSTTLVCRTEHVYNASFQAGWSKHA